MKQKLNFSSWKIIFNFSPMRTEKNPLVKDVYNTMDKLKEDLEMWKTKLQKIKAL